MNALCLFPNELLTPKTALLSGERNLRLRRQRTPEVGERLTVVIWGLTRAIALVTSTSELETHFSIEQDLDPILRPTSVLIVATPRPQAVKRILQLAIAFGVTDLHFIRSEKTEKSYLSSHALGADELREQCILALEQTMDCMAPSIAVHQHFKPFMQDELPKISGICQVRWFADTESSAQTLPAYVPAGSGIAIAVGPEAGWNAFERKQFVEGGFVATSLGARILKVDIAVGALLAHQQWLANCWGA